MICNDVLILSDLFDAPYRKDRSNHGSGLLVYINSDHPQKKAGLG